MDVKQELLEYKKRVDPVIKGFFKEKELEYQGFSPFAKQFTKQVSEFTLRGGKRLRPALFYYSYRLFSDEKLEEAMRTSIFLEILQSFLLIHDDIIDSSELRRGAPTVHKAFEEISEREGYGDVHDFGNTMGILGGDLASQFMYEIVARSKFSHDSKNAVVEFLSREITTVILGEVEDVLISHNQNYTEKEIENIHENKTAVYTFRLPMLAGALLAGKERRELDALESYAIPCGIAFQIWDDVLGVLGNDKKTGKPIKSDVTEGKKTLLTHHAFNVGTKAQRQVLEESLGNADLTDKEFEQFREVIVETGALEQSKKRCQQLVEQGKTALENVETSDQEAKDFLLGLADYVISRES